MFGTLRGLRFRLALLGAAVLVVACGGGSSVEVAGDAVAEATARATFGTTLLEAMKALESAKAAIQKVSAGPLRPEEVAALERAQVALLQAIAQQQELQRKADEVAEGVATLAGEAQSLQKAKEDLMRREQTLSTSLIASVTAAVLAVMGLVINFPVQLAERRLKLLLIEEKKIALRDAKTSPRRRVKRPLA